MKCNFCGGISSSLDGGIATIVSESSWIPHEFLRSRKQEFESLSYRKLWGQGILDIDHEHDIIFDTASNTLSVKSVEGRCKRKLCVRSFCVYCHRKRHQRWTVSPEKERKQHLSTYCTVEAVRTGGKCPIISQRSRFFVIVSSMSCPDTRLAAPWSCV